jgi:hypothetical protein
MNEGKLFDIQTNQSFMKLIPNLTQFSLMIIDAEKGLRFYFPQHYANDLRRKRNIFGMAKNFHTQNVKCQPNLSSVMSSKVPSVKMSTV